MHETMRAFVDHLAQRGKHETVRGYKPGLQQFAAWCIQHGIDPLRATTDDLLAFQRWLAEECVSARGGRLERSTQATRLSGVKAYYAWLVRRGALASDPSKEVKLPKVAKQVTRKDYLSLQEATALLQCQAKHVVGLREGSHRWAVESRNLALICLAIATGRRRSGLLNLRVADLNLDRNEVRFAWEKGKAGRVMPAAGWAMAIVREYVEKARPVLANGSGNGCLFVGSRSERMGDETLAVFLKRVHTQTVDGNPDLEELADKVISAHSLRVSFACLLFNGGCNIRSINELMQHENLSTTAGCTPIPLENLRRACRLAHPRA